MSDTKESYKVQVTKDYLVFSAAHFITYNDDVCERLHGHNYRVTAEVYGPLDENHYVIDFVALRDALHRIVLELDHRMLLPTDHERIHVAAGESEVLVTFADRRWIFPRDDCLLLPVANTTSELLAKYIGQKLLQEMKDAGISRPSRLRIHLDENHGQGAVCDLQVADSA